MTIFAMQRGFYFYFIAIEKQDKDFKRFLFSKVSSAFNQLLFFLLIILFSGSFIKRNSRQNNAGCEEL